MFKKKSYQILDMIIIQLKLIPVQTIYLFLNMLIMSLMPAFQTLSLSFFVNTAMDILNNKQEISKIYVPLFLILIYILITNMLPNITSLIQLNGKNKLMLTLDKDIQLKKSRLQFEHFENKETCELINRVTKNFIGDLSKGIDNIFNGISLILSSISLIIIIMSNSFLSGIIIIIISLPLFYFANKVGKKNYNMEIQSRNIQRKYNYLSDLLVGRSNVKERTLFSYSNTLRDKYNNFYSKSVDIEEKMILKTFAYLKSGSIITLFIAIIIISLLIPTLINKKMSTGIFIALVPAILNLVQSMSWQLSDITQTNSWTQEFMKEFTIFINLSEKRDANCLPIYDNDFVFESLEFKNVSFRYPKTQRYILNNCSFKMLNNKSYSIVGENGAGKSTIIKLLTGMYENYEAQILINNKDLKEYSFGFIKGITSIITQDFTKFALTIKDNVELGNMNKKDSKLIDEVLCQMGLEALIQKLPHGIETYIGKIKKESVDISDGQWQRLVLSRLLYSNSPINILDEPTASLDPIEESKVYQMLKELNRDKFTIFITHRLGAAKTSDEILVIANGNVAECGTHDNLMQKENGIYKNMFNTQHAWYNL